MMLEEFEMPDPVIWDNESGWAVNVPFSMQGYPGWSTDPQNAEAVQRILTTREELGLSIEDFPNGPEGDPWAGLKAAFGNHDDGP